MVKKIKTKKSFGSVRIDHTSLAVPGGTLKALNLQREGKRASQAPRAGEADPQEIRLPAGQAGPGHRDVTQASRTPMRRLGDLAPPYGIGSDGPAKQSLLAQFGRRGNKVNYCPSSRRATQFSGDRGTPLCCFPPFDSTWRAIS